MAPTPLFNKSTPIKAGEIDQYQPALTRTQGNILKSHGRFHTVNIFLLFTGDPAKLRAAIRGLNVTSAWEQSRQRPEHHALFMGFGLSSVGYLYLGFDASRFASAAF